MAKVLVTYKINKDTGHPHRPPFETTDANLQDHERLFSNIIKDVKYIDIQQPKNVKRTDAPSGKPEDTSKVAELTKILKERDALIVSLQGGIEKLNAENDELRDKLKKKTKVPA